MLTNPLITMREALDFSQQDLANAVGASQQFIQRHERGMASTLPNRIGDFLDYKTPPTSRLNILGDIIEAANSFDLDQYIPPSYIIGGAFWQDSCRTSVGLYNLWVKLSRAGLPGMSHLLSSVRFDPDFPDENRRAARQVFEYIRNRLGIQSDLSDSEQRYEVAAALCIHPFVLANFLQRADRLTGFPPTIRKALADTPTVIPKPTHATKSTEPGRAERYV